MAGTLPPQANLNIPCAVNDEEYIEDFEDTLYLHATVQDQAWLKIHLPKNAHHDDSPKSICIYTTSSPDNCSTSDDAAAAVDIKSEVDFVNENGTLEDGEDFDCTANEHSIQTRKDVNGFDFDCTANEHSLQTRKDVNCFDFDCTANENSVLSRKEVKSFDFDCTANEHSLQTRKDVNGFDFDCTANEHSLQTRKDVNGFDFDCTVNEHSLQTREANTDSTFLRIDNLLKLHEVSPLVVPYFFGFERIVKETLDGENSSPKGIVYYKTQSDLLLPDSKSVHEYLLRMGLAIPISMFSFEANVRPFHMLKLDMWKGMIHKADISEGQERIPIQAICAESRDVVGLANYVSSNFIAKDLQISFDHNDKFLVCCDCTDDCSDKLKCACFLKTLDNCSDKTRRTYGDEYIGYGFQRLERPCLTGIFECNRMCKCKRTCFNRASQNGIFCRLQLFMTDRKGWGVRTLCDIPKGTYVSHYCGKIVSNKYADEVSSDLCRGKWRYLSLLDVGEEKKEGYESDVVEPTLSNCVTKEKPKDPLEDCSSFITNNNLTSLNLKPNENNMNEQACEENDISLVSNSDGNSSLPLSLSPTTPTVTSGECTVNVNYVDIPSPATSSFVADLYPDSLIVDEATVPPPYRTMPFVKTYTNMPHNVIAAKNRRLRRSKRGVCSQSHFAIPSNKFTTFKTMTAREFRRIDAYRESSKLAMSPRLSVGNIKPKYTHFACIDPEVGRPNFILNDTKQTTLIKYNNCDNVKSRKKTPTKVKTESRITQRQASKVVNFLKLDPSIQPQEQKKITKLCSSKIKRATRKLSFKKGSKAAIESNIGLSSVKKRKCKRNVWTLPRSGNWFGNKKIRKGSKTNAHHSDSVHELLQLDLNIDGLENGNVGRYFNHSCNPNLFPQYVFVNCHDLRLPYICFFAMRNIHAGEELTWDYKYEKDDDEERMSRCRKKTANPTSNIRKKSITRIPCYCGQDNCTLKLC